MVSAIERHVLKELSKPVYIRISPIISHGRKKLQNSVEIQLLNANVKLRDKKIIKRICVD